MGIDALLDFAHRGMILQTGCRAIEFALEDRKFGFHFFAVVRHRFRLGRLA